MSANLDLIDRKLLYELDQNSRLPITRLARKLKISKETANYRMHNLLRAGIIKKFIAQIDPTKLGYSVYKMFFKFQNLTKEKEKEMLDWLIKNDYVYWIADAKGKWDMNITVFANNINHFDEILSGFITKFGRHIAEQEFNTTLNVGLYAKAYLLPEKSSLKKSCFIWGSADNVKIDSADVSILRLLANNARMNAIEIAKNTKTTQRTVIYRIKELEKKKIIIGYSISVDYEKLEKQFFKAIIYFNVLDNATKRKIEEYCKSRQSIIYFVFCVGSWPLEIEFIVKDNKEFYDEMDKFREVFPEMKGYETLIFPREYKFDWMPLCYKASNE